MVRTQIQLTESQAEALKKLASQKKVSVAEIVRRGVDIVLTQELVCDPEEIRRRAIAAAGAFRSDKSDVSERHDDYLAEAYAE